MVTKTIWISYDLGVGGDYESLYAWFDNNGAIECGNSLAYMKFDIANDDDELLLETLKKSISENVEINAKSRIYIIRRLVKGDDSKVVGKFIFGKRKGNPWDGFGNKENLTVNDGE